MSEEYYEPEMGQMAFGCAWGDYELYDERVDRRLVTLSEEVLEILGPEIGDSDGGYGQEFKNEVFEMHRYYWGDCTCGYEEKEHRWTQENEHREECYQELVDADLRVHGWSEEYGWLTAPKDLTYEEKHTIEDEVRRKYCDHFGLPFPAGSAVHCTCDYRERWAKFVSENSHDPICPIVVPNFRHFASGIEVRWYKYVGRGMSVNRKASWEEWRHIFEECTLSLKGYESPGLVAQLRDFFGDRGFSLGQDGNRWFLLIGLDFPGGVSDRIRDEGEAILELFPYMLEWAQKLNQALPDYEVAWADTGKPFWPSYILPPFCGPDGVNEESRAKFPEEVAIDEEAMEYYEWDDDPDLPPFRDERWKAVRWAGINTRLILTPRGRQ